MAYSHQEKTKANAEAKKVKEQAKEIEEKIPNIKQNFAFARCEWVSQLS